MRTLLPTTDYVEYTRAWDNVAAAGTRQFNVDTWAAGHRYLSLAAVALTPAEANQLREVTRQFGPLLDQAVAGVLSDSTWWPALAWPWAAIELARQEPPHANGCSSLFGRFDCLLDHSGTWQVIEYNADTPSGGREATGLEPAIARLYPGSRRLSAHLAAHLARAVVERIHQHEGPVRLVGIVAPHNWLEDLSQAVWLARLLEGAGQPCLVGDVRDLEARRGRITLRGRAVDALYRFYPFERLYRHAIFASLCDAAIDGRLLLLNGLRDFLAQSKACLAWLWANRSQLPPSDCQAVERHLPRTVLAAEPSALELLADAVVKHVNGREGDSVVFGDALEQRGWEERLLEGGYVVQRRVRSPALEDVDVDDWRREVRVLDERCACVGAFSIGGDFAGCYTRLDGPITSARATYAATLVAP